MLQSLQHALNVYNCLHSADVGALIERPRREKFRIRIGSQRIRNSVPQRAINDRPYVIHGTLPDTLQFAQQERTG